MRSPAGELSTGEACFFRPAADSDLPFTAIITMRPEGTGMRYNATVRHRDPEGREKLEKMGFHRDGAQPSNNWWPMQTRRCKGEAVSSAPARGPSPTS